MELITQQSGFQPNSIADKLLFHAYFQFKVFNELYYSVQPFTFKQFSELLITETRFYLHEFHEIAVSLSSEQYRDYLADLTSLHSLAHDRDAFIQLDSKTDCESHIDIKIEA